MVINLTPDQIVERLAAFQARRRQRLILEARALKLRVEPDEISGGYAVRSPKRRGYVELVTEAGCTCEEYRMLGSCAHSVAVELESERRVVA